MHERSEFRIQGSRVDGQSSMGTSTGSGTLLVQSPSVSSQAAVGADSLSEPSSSFAAPPQAQEAVEDHAQPIDIDGEALEPEDLLAPTSPAPPTPPVVLQVLYLFAGKERKTDVSHMIRMKAKEVDLPIEVEEVDTCRGDHCDIGSSAVWDPIVIRLRAGGYAALIASPPM